MNIKLSKELKVGIFGIIVIGLFYGGFNFLKGHDLFSSKLKYYAIYDQIEGLTVSNPVMVNGYAVGRVKKIKILPEKGNKIKVTFSIDKEIIVDSATKAVIINSDILGSKALRLELGESKNRLPDNSKVKGTREKGVTQEIQEQTAPLITKLDTALIRLNGLINPTNRMHIQQTLANIEKSSHNLNKYLVQNQKNVSKITENMVHMTDSLLKAQKNLEPAINNLKSFSDSLKQIKFKSTINKIDKSVASLNNVVNKINKGKGTFGEAVNNPELYNNLNKSTQDLDSLILDIKKNPKKYVKFSLF